MHIGFFDSGIGGITVLFEALKLLPNEDYIYYADAENAPYGNKPKGEIKECVFKAADFIVDHGVKALVIACNTATSAAIEDLRGKYSIPIIGMEPAVKPAVEKNGNNHRRVLVTATAFTLKEEKLMNLIDRLDNENIVDLLPLPGLVEFAEKFEYNEEIVGQYLQRELGNYNLELYGTIVLGCTHFPIYRNIFRKVLPGNIDIIDGNIGTVKNLKKVLEENGHINEGTGKIIFYNSGIKVNDSDISVYEGLFRRLHYGTNL